MVTGRLPLRARVALVLLAVAALVVVGGATAAVHVGARALGVGGAFTVTSSWDPGSRWAGIEVANRSDVPVVLHAVEARAATNVTVLETRVIEPGRSHLLMLTAPPTADLRRAIAASSPVDGFVLPPHSGERFQIAVRFRPTTIGQAVLGRTAITYGVRGLEQGAVSDGVFCVRAPGARGCRFP